MYVRVRVYVASLVCGFHFVRAERVCACVHVYVCMWVCKCVYGLKRCGYVAMIIQQK
jgi:hypothetical protein